jgi:2-(1,2-epoxy-1,2-dihydrophenyl)acetyl-CoA isomerase
MISLSACPERLPDPGSTRLPGTPIPNYLVSHDLMALVIITQYRDHWVIRLNRPDKLNTFNDDLHLELIAAIDEADADHSCRALLLTGTGRAFCAGADLAATVGTDHDVDLGDVLERTFNPLIRRIRNLRLPVVCAVNGIAAGAGANLAFACDIVVASRSAKFVQAFVNIGLVPDAGGSWLLPRLAGEARARGMAMLGEPVTAEQAEAWGMIWRVVEDDKLFEEAMRVATHLAGQPTTALTLMKRMFTEGANNTLDEQLNAERDSQKVAGGTRDFKEGVESFLQKRSPRFSGY